jgi:ABC-type phosphate transport system permease subunit
MGESKRAGLWICAAVLALYLVQIVGVIVSWYQNPARDFAVLTPLVGAIVALPSIVFGFRKGERAVRGASCVCLVLFGVILIASGYWMTTLEFPNAVSAEERARMQETCRREWPWWAALGALNILAGTLLILPPVGRFLQARREALAPKVAERQKSGSAS